MIKNRKWLLEVTEEQLMLIARCVEDCSRFASGQCEMHHTTSRFDNYLEIKYAMEHEVEPIVAPNGRGSYCKWNGIGAKNEPTRKFIAATYGIYREILHRYTLANGINNVYTSETLTCPEQGGLPIVKLK